MNDLAAAFTMCLFIGWLCWMAHDARVVDEHSKRRQFTGNREERP